MPARRPLHIEAHRKSPNVVEGPLGIESQSEPRLILYQRVHIVHMRL